MQFSDRPSSNAWEPLPLADAPQCCLWTWFKPPAAPHGIFVQIPPETFRDPTRRQPITLITVLNSLGIDPRAVSAWSLYGVTNDARQGTNPALGLPVSEPAAGVDPTIGIFLNPAVAPAAPPMPAPSSGTPGDALARIEAAWNACLQIETQVAAVGKQLNAMMTRLNSLNRDLSSEENRFADNQDKREWQDARRWLRDIANRISRAIKDHYIGITSDAGKRQWFDKMYREHVVPKRPFAGMEQTERDYELYRKTLQSLLNNMVAVHGTAAQDGERRAQVVLSRISARVRTTRAKRT